MRADQVRASLRPGDHGSLHPVGGEIFPASGLGSRGPECRDRPPRPLGGSGASDRVDRGGRVETSSITSPPKSAAQTSLCTGLEVRADGLVMPGSHSQGQRLRSAVRRSCTRACRSRRGRGAPAGRSTTRDARAIRGRRRGRRARPGRGAGLVRQKPRRSSGPHPRGGVGHQPTSPRRGERRCPTAPPTPTWVSSGFPHRVGHCPVPHCPTSRSPSSATVSGGATVILPHTAPLPHCPAHL